VKAFRCLLLAIAVFTGAGSCAEPIYEGKPESFWISSLTNGWQKFYYDSNAVPLLLKAVTIRNAPNVATIRSNAAALPSCQVPFRPAPVAVFDDEAGISWQNKIAPPHAGWVGDRVVGAAAAAEPDARRGFARVSTGRF
jgi:hypothetical protein